MAPTAASNHTTGRPLISCACRPPNRCPNATASVCRTNRQCYFHRRRDARSGEVEESLGCWSNDRTHHLMYCRIKPVPDQAMACCNSDMCNLGLDPQFPQLGTGRGVSDSGLSSRKPTLLGGAPARLEMAVIVPLLLLVVLLGLMALLWRLVLRPRLKEYALKASASAGKAKSACASVAHPDLLPPGVGAGPGSGPVAPGGPADGSSSLRAQHVGESTLQRLYDISCSSGSGSGLPFLVQRTVARQVSLVDCIGKGRYGEVWRGDYHGEPVAVKIFSSREEASWSRETEMYNTLLLRHENILGYFASDMTSRYGCTQLWLITHYHPLGSLFDYLSARVVEPEAGLALMASAAAGLCHLHTEIFGCQGKPGIAHRDVKSKNILVRVNGSCCIADLGLSVTYSQASDELNMGRAPSSTPGQLPNNKVGTKRYMAPEVLSEAHCRPGLSRAAAFELLKAADVYALALVAWEVCRRCVAGGSADEYQIPFAGRVPADPSYEQMKALVCDRGERPPLSPRWAADRGLGRVARLLSEAWHAQPDVRLSALRVKKTLARLLEESRAERPDRDPAPAADSPGGQARQAFCESSCEDASVSFCGSSSHSSNSLLKAASGSASGSGDGAKALLLPCGPAPALPDDSPALPALPGDADEAEKLLGRTGDANDSGDADAGRLLSGAAEKKAIIQQLMA